MRRGCIISLGVFLLLLASGLYFFFPRDYSATAKGSPEYALKWRDELNRFDDPESAQAAHPEEVVMKRFDNGTWVFGVCRCSHRYRDGGTIVVKESTGKVRAFFGHVCGPDALKGLWSRAKTPDQFYLENEALNAFNFREYHFE